MNKLDYLGPNAEHMPRDPVGLLKAARLADKLAELDRIGQRMRGSCIREGRGLFGPVLVVRESDEDAG